MLSGVLKVLVVEQHADCLPYSDRADVDRREAYQLELGLHPTGDLLSQGQQEAKAPVTGERGKGCDTKDGAAGATKSSHPLTGRRLSTPIHDGDLQSRLRAHMTVQAARARERRARLFARFIVAPGETPHGARSKLAPAAAISALPVLQR